MTDVVATASPEGWASTPHSEEVHHRTGIAPLAHIDDRLGRLVGGVALVAAPAGYGKTTQVSLWADSQQRPVLWADLEATDNDPRALTNCLASMVETVSPARAWDATPVGAEAHPLMVVPTVTALLRGVDRPVVMVLDDVHVLDDPGALEVLDAVVSHVPRGSTVVLVGRSIPELSLGQLRIDGLVDEITASDLALDTEQALAIFEMAGLDLEPDVAGRYVAATEGWPVGLRLSAIALREDHDTPPEALARDRILDEFVRHEWLRGLDADDMEFLLRVSVLDWMSGEVCDQVLGRSDSGARLERLHRCRLLVVPLDRRGDAYRMHGLLREVLDTEFERRDRATRRDIDRAASEWFEARHDIERAVHHALRAGDLDLVERLIVRHAPVLHTRGRYVTVRRWLDQFPTERISDTPGLCLVAALTCIGLGRDEEAKAWLGAGLAKQPAPDAGCEAHTYYELLALKSMTSTGPVTESLAGSMTARDALLPGPWHAAAATSVGALLIMLGDDDGAEAALLEGAAEAGLHGAITVRAIGLANLAGIHTRRGDWKRATELAHEARQLVRAHGLEHMPTMVIVTAISALVEASGGDPATARAEVLLTRRSLSFIDGISGSPNVMARLWLAHASLLLSDGAGARVLLDEAGAFLQAQPDAVGARAMFADLSARVEAARGALPVGPSSLTTAELRVLHLLPTNLSIAAIADRLYVSRNTAKSHAAAIYRKFGVSSRSEAVSVAREVGLLPR